MPESPIETVMPTSLLDAPGDHRQRLRRRRRRGAVLVGQVEIGLVQRDRLDHRRGGQEDGRGSPRSPACTWPCRAAAPPRPGTAPAPGTSASPSARRRCAPDSRRWSPRRARPHARRSTAGPPGSDRRASRRRRRRRRNRCGRCRGHRSRHGRPAGRSRRRRIGQSQLSRIAEQSRHTAYGTAPLARRISLPRPCGWRCAARRRRRSLCASRWPMCGSPATARRCSRASRRRWSGLSIDVRAASAASRPEVRTTTMMLGENGSNGAEACAGTDAAGTVEGLMAGSGRGWLARGLASRRPVPSPRRACSGAAAAGRSPAAAAAPALALVGGQIGMRLEDTPEVRVLGCTRQSSGLLCPSHPRLGRFRPQLR